MSGAAGAASAEPAAGREVTRIAAGTKVAGTLSGAAELLVEGEVEGEIKVESVVVVGAGGVVRGPISAQRVQVMGKVLGNVRGSDRVEVDAAGTLEGDIAAPRVVIAEGAFFKGKVEMTGDKAKDERPASRGPARPGKGE
ncbi:MAG TPA: polymer-forming cytoskeletal protein [Thermoanaerobaculia bacterium]|nr:polymer-forming cytoskeletal protein [Thermoanaerobaculia bacterium]